MDRIAWVPGVEFVGAEPSGADRDDAERITDGRWHLMPRRPGPTDMDFEHVQNTPNPFEDGHLYLEVLVSLPQHSGR